MKWFTLLKAMQLFMVLLISTNIIKLYLSNTKIVDIDFEKLLSFTTNAGV